MSGEESDTVNIVLPTYKKLNKTFRSHKTKKAWWRVEQLNNCLKGLAEMENEMNEAMRQDLGRDLFVNYAAEFALLIADVRHNLYNLKDWMKDKSEKLELIMAPGAAYTRYEPLGVVGVFGSWNAPYITAMKPMFQAITAGNCVIVKPSEVSSNSSACIKKFVTKYLDAEAIAVIEGGVSVAQEINQLPLDLICFTGSTAVGKIIAQTAAKNLTPCILELGGKCPAIIDHSANLGYSSARVAFGKTCNSGQICISPDYVFVHESKLKLFVQMVELRFKQMYGEKPDGSELQGKIINEFHLNRLEKLIQGAGGTIVCGGKVNREARHIEPTVILQPNMNSDLMKQEIFGPIMPIIPFKDIREVVKHINKGEKPLAVYYFGNSTGQNSAILSRETSSGAYVTNDCLMQINSNEMGFGGVGHSGYGRHGGFEGFKCFSNKKAIVLKNAAPESVTKLLLPPFSPRMQAFLRSWLPTFLTTTVSDVMFYIKGFFLLLVLLLIKWLFLLRKGLALAWKWYTEQD